MRQWVVGEDEPSERYAFCRQDHQSKKNALPQPPARAIVEMPTPQKGEGSTWCGKRRYDWSGIIQITERVLHIWLQYVVYTCATMGT